MKLIFGILAIVSLMACNQASQKSSDHKDSIVKDSTVNIAVTLKDKKLDQIYISYIALKDALVESDSVNAQEKASVLHQNLKGFEGCESTAVGAEKISKNNNLVAQRKVFTSISSDLVALFKHAELSEGTIFVQHCPMANKGDGGDWLSSEKDIKNPYYGDEMLNCGSVVEEIKSK